MIHLRKASERGHFNHGWLDTYHSFSFADYYDEKHMGFGSLRVINEDRIAGGTGFDTHGHKDMEIISYVVDGELQHQDSMGNTTVIQPGEVQRMSAGTGIRHSERNGQKDRVTHLLQIWVLPETRGITPSYAQKSFKKVYESGDLVLVASKSGRDGSITIHSDIDMYVAQSQKDQEVIHKTSVHRKLWIQVIQGEVTLEGTNLCAGDGAGIENVESLHLKWKKGSEFILFDMP